MPKGVVSWTRKLEWPRRERYRRVIDGEITWASRVSEGGAMSALLVSCAVFLGLAALAVYYVMDEWSPLHSRVAHVWIGVTVVFFLGGIGRRGGEQ